MGIPLTGTITQFQTKLQAKGVTYDKVSSLQMQSGIRVFNGTFSGYKSTIYVYYDSDTKLVYSARAYIFELSEERAKQVFEDLKYKIQTKYKEYYIAPEEYDKDDKYSMITLNKNDIDTGADDIGVVGIISVHKSENENSLGYPYHYNVYISYEDIINSAKLIEKEMDDI